MRYRFLTAAVLFASALGLQAQQEMFRIELVPSGHMISLDEPTFLGDTYVFREWPDGAPTTLKKASVQRITRLTGGNQDTVYRIELNPSGGLVARDNPILRNGLYTFHTWRGGTLMSVRTADVLKITTLTGDEAFWAEQAQFGEALIGNLAMQGGGRVIQISSPPPSNTSQAGPSSVSSLNGSGISGAPAYGNWMYQGTPGVSDAYAPANASVSSPGGVPTMPAATSGMSPPH